jgi:hypothetical protein
MSRPMDENEARELEKPVHDMVAVVTAEERLELLDRLYRFLRDLNGPRPLPH